MIFILLINAPIKPYYNGLGLSEPGILLAAGLLLFMPPFSILDWMQDKENIPYRIMFLFGAGFAIATAFTKTGMASEIASHLVSFSNMPILLFLLIIAVMVTFTTEITSNTALATMPGNVFVPAAVTGRPRDSVVNVTALVTLNKTDLTDRVGQVPPSLMREVDRGLRRVLDL